MPHSGTVTKGLPLNANVIVYFVSNVNETLFMQILKEDEHMTEALKELIEPDLIKLRLVIADKDAIIANRETEIAMLKQQLLEANYSH